MISFEYILYDEHYSNICNYHKPFLADHSKSSRKVEILQKSKSVEVSICNTRDQSTC